MTTEGEVEENTLEPSMSKFSFISYSLTSSRNSSLSYLHFRLSHVIFLPIELAYRVIYIKILFRRKFKFTKHIYKRRAVHKKTDARSYLFAVYT